MAIIKNNKKGKCPFMLFDPCNEECVFYRKGIRYSDKPGEDPVPFEDCAINIIADNLEAMHNRTYMMQKEVGETKNIIALKTMIDLKMGNAQEVQYLKDQVVRLSSDTSKLIES
jgi:hypothetical protein